jgi:kynurenine 3-monooxygenase
MALRNFIEMRDLAGRASFIWKKRVEHWLQAIMPNAFTPLYDLVSFSTVPYTEAKERGLASERRVKRIIAIAASLALGGTLLGVLLATGAVP